MPALAITVIGHDRPGIIADVTSALGALGGNVEDSSMTLLRGHFAMTLILAVDASEDQVSAALQPVVADGSLSARVAVVAEEPDDQPSLDGADYLMTVHGADHPGIVAATTRVLAEAGGNITDLSTRLSTGGLYVVTVEVTLPSDVGLSALQERLAAVAAQVGVTASLRAIEADVL